MLSPPLGAPPSPPWRSNPPAKTNSTSLLALLSSLSGYVCLLGIGGALGVVLGLVAKSEIARSEGRERGRSLATASIVLGVLNIGLTLVGLAVGLTYLARPKPIVASRAAPTITVPGWPGSAPSASPHPPKSVERAPAPRSSHESGEQITRLGTITVVDVSGDLGSELDTQRSAAAETSETLILWLVVPNCKPCDGVAAALTSPIAQKSLAKIRFVRADRDEFQMELERLGVPTEQIPGFALLDADNHARDFIHGGEWDADVAANIAPVLAKFAHGAYTRRRHPWRGPAREDETSL